MSVSAVDSGRVVGTQERPPRRVDDIENDSDDRWSFSRIRSAPKNHLDPLSIRDSFIITCPESGRVFIPISGVYASRFAEAPRPGSIPASESEWSEMRHCTGPWQIRVSHVVRGTDNGVE